LDELDDYIPSLSRLRIQQFNTTYGIGQSPITR
jgi:hypothetical protein